MRKQAHLVREDNGHRDASDMYQFGSDGDRLLIHVQDRRILDLESGQEQPISLREARQLDEFPEQPSARKSPQPSPVPDEVTRQLADKLPEPATEYQLTEDGSKLIVYHQASSVTLWDVTSSEMLSRCHILDRGTGFVTISSDGTVHGNREYIRYRRPDTIQLIDAQSP